MSMKNITTHWAIKNNYALGHVAPIIVVQDDFGNTVSLFDNSSVYKLLENLYYDKEGIMTTEEIFEVFQPSKHPNSNITVNEYHIKKYVLTDFKQTDFKQLEIPISMFHDVQYGTGGNLSRNHQHDMCSFVSTLYIYGNKKYYLSDDVYLMTIVHDDPLDNMIYKTNILLGLDDTNSNSQLKAVQVKYNIEDEYGEDVLIDIHLKELCIDFK